MSKIIVRFTKESIESIYRGKEIVREDGSKVRLFVAVDAPEDFDKKSLLYVQTAIVEAVSEDVTDIQIGDVAIVNYDLFNSVDHIIERNDEGVSYWLNPTTTYCETTITAYANRKSPRDQIVQTKGEYDEISFLLGIIRDDKLIARKPYVFIDHESNIIQKVSRAGIFYEETQKTVIRRILSVPEIITKSRNLHDGDKIMMFDLDVFEVKLDNKTVSCVCDIDIIAKIVEGQKYPVPI